MTVAKDTIQFPDIEPASTYLTLLVLKLYQSIFAGTFSLTPSGNKFLLVAVWHITGWLIIIPATINSAETVMEFMTKEISEFFHPLAW